MKVISRNQARAGRRPARAWFKNYLSSICYPLSKWPSPSANNYSKYHTLKLTISFGYKPSKRGNRPKILFAQLEDNDNNGDSIRMLRYDVGEGREATLSVGVV